MALPLPRVFGDVQRNRAVWAEKSEKIYQQFRRTPVVGRMKLCQRGGCKCQRWHLPEAHRIVARTQRSPDARFFGKTALDQPKRPKEVECEWLRSEPLY
jgi:hypothetical protein